MINAVLDHCKDCRFWMDDGDCSSGKVPQDEAIPTDGLIYGDSYPDDPHIFTGPNFGCIHWKGRGSE